MEYKKHSAVSPSRLLSLYASWIDEYFPTSRVCSVMISNNSHNQGQYDPFEGFLNLTKSLVNYLFYFKLQKLEKFENYFFLCLSGKIQFLTLLSFIGWKKNAKFCEMEKVSRGNTGMANMKVQTNLVKYMLQKK